MPERLTRPSLGERLSDCLDEIAKLVDDAELEAWIKQQPCYLCGLKSSPRGPSDPHHTGKESGDSTRRGLPYRVPQCRHHHDLMRDEPYLEGLLNLKRVARYYLVLFLLEKWFWQRQKGASVPA